jgi:16S rRNA (adenine1518-N6/adenine1519-N6)-dimethyltransferase
MLAERAGRLIATEFDRELARNLKQQFADSENVTIVEADFLSVTISELVASTSKADSERVKVIGNIPYYITSDILLRLFAQHEHVDTVVLMLQKEVADRMVAEPHTRDYGLLTVTAQLFTNVERLLTLPPGAFSPPPQVHSSVLRMCVVPKAKQLGVDANEFLDFCKLAFAQKRKTLFNNLRLRYEEGSLKVALAKTGVEPSQRAEELTLEALARIYNELCETARRSGER